MAASHSFKCLLTSTVYRVLYPAILGSLIFDLLDPVRGFGTGRVACLIIGVLLFVDYLHLTFNLGVDDDTSGCECPQARSARPPRGLAKVLLDALIVVLVSVAFYSAAHAAQSKALARDATKAAKAAGETSVDAGADGLTSTSRLWKARQTTDEGEARTQTATSRDQSVASMWILVAAFGLALAYEWKSKGTWNRWTLLVFGGGAIVHVACAIITGRNAPVSEIAWSEWLPTLLVTIAYGIYFVVRFRRQRAA